jgi:hydrogenase-4 transcriptional activator
MVTRNSQFSKRVDETMAAAHSALEDGRFEEASGYFAAALKQGPLAPGEEAGIRCGFSLSLEKRGLHREQLEIVSKYETLANFSRLSEQTQMLVLIRLGWAYSFNNDIPRAIALFNQSMNIARGLEDEEGIGFCYFGLGRAYRFVSEIRIARDQYTSALEHFRHVGNWRELAESYYNIGNIDAREGDFRNALHSINQALAMVGHRNEPELLGRCYNDLALINDCIGAPAEKVLACHETSVEHYRRAGNTVSLAVNNNNLSAKLMWMGQWPRAERLMRSAVEMLKGTIRVAQYGAALDTLALMCLLTGRIEEGDRLAQESLEAFETIKSDRHPLTKDHPFEPSTQVTIGRSYLLKGLPEQAVVPLERAVDIATRLGDRQYISEARLWLAEAFLRSGTLDQARKQFDDVRAALRDAGDLLAWALTMRMSTKLDAAAGHLAAAIQAIGQSNSIYEIKGHIYDRAINRTVLARVLEKQGRFEEAIKESNLALEVFRNLGAFFDIRDAELLLTSLNQSTARTGNKISTASQLSQQTANYVSSSLPPLVSVLDGFIAQRLVQAAVSRELLLRELASVSAEQSESRGALVAEIMAVEEPLDRRFKVAAAVGLNADEQREAIDFLAGLPRDEYERSFVYRLGDNEQTDFLLYLIEPASDRFKNGAVRMEPMLSLVELGLERHLLRSKHRRTHVFDPARLLTQVEIPGFVCASRAMSRVLEQIHKIRSSDVTVLITGESGTGKELIARAVHASSSRRFRLFLPFNSSAAPHDMVESQLFGYRKGAFTGAVASNQGMIRSAEGGTLFLDEIGDLPLDLQPKLLRFLQEGEIQPIGDNQPLHVDVRVVAATNSDLERAVSEGRFREDLFHRLNVIRIQVPPLRERREEIPALVNYYLNLYQQQAAKCQIQLSEETVDLMVVYDWPGNVRQLCNEIRRIVAYIESNTIATPDSLSPEIVRASREIQPASPIHTRPPDLSVVPAEESTLSEAVEELERRMIQNALHKSSGNVARAAKELGLSRRGLYMKMDRLNFRS